MSIELLIPDMNEYTNPHYLKVVKKINELIKETNESFQADLKIRNEIVGIKKDILDLQNAVRNR